MHFFKLLSRKQEFFPLNYIKYVEHGCFTTNVTKDFTVKSKWPLAATVYSDCARLRNPKVIMQTSPCISSVVRALIFMRYQVPK